jgi:zinc transport system ATP-binding protein
MSTARPIGAASNDGTIAPAIEVRDATVSLGGRPVLRRADLRVAAGELVALLGTNGSGKSTLVRACVGLLPLVSGDVAILGTPLARFRDWHRVGYVPQKPSASAGVPATVREVVATGRLALRRPFAPGTARDRREVDRALAQVGLHDRSRDSVAQLSGGQQQRVMIARALAGAPDLLVLDEPTAGVDQESQLVLAEVLTALVRSGAAVLLVTHELGPLEPLVDRAVVLHDGRVVHDGPARTFPAVHDHVHPHTGEPSRDDVLRGEGMWR